MSIEVSVFGGDINDVDADIVAVPIDARLKGDRSVVKAVIGACASAVGASLQRLAAAIPTGVAPGAVVLLPADGHKRFRLIALVVLFDNRDGAMAQAVEPDDDRIARCSTALWKVLNGHDDGVVALVPFGGRTGDAGEAAATCVRAYVEGAAVRQAVFVERDDVTRADVCAAVESIGVPVRRG
jgi:hypothetical protein